MVVNRGPRPGVRTMIIIPWPVGTQGILPDSVAIIRDLQVQSYTDSREVSEDSMVRRD